MTSPVFRLELGSGMEVEEEELRPDNFQELLQELHSLLVGSVTQAELKVHALVEEAAKEWREGSPGAVQPAMRNQSPLPGEDIAELGKLLEQSGLRSIVVRCPGAVHGRRMFSTIYYEFLRVTGVVARAVSEREALCHGGSLETPSSALSVKQTDPGEAENSESCTCGSEGQCKSAEAGHLPAKSERAHCAISLDDQEDDIIIDPHFKEQFQTQPTIAWYVELLKQVPDIFVGSSLRLVYLVRFLCRSMDQAFKSQKLGTPPWRRQEPMLAKWVPQDLSITLSTGSASSGQTLSAALQLAQATGDDHESERPECPPQMKVTGFHCNACHNLEQHLGGTRVTAEALSKLQTQLSGACISHGDTTAPAQNVADAVRSAAIRAAAQGTAEVIEVTGGKALLAPLHELPPNIRAELLPVVRNVNSGQQPSSLVVAGISARENHGGSVQASADSVDPEDLSEGTPTADSHNRADDGGKE